MKILVESGLVTARKAGKWAYYSISQQGVVTAKELLHELTIVTEIDNKSLNPKCK